MVTRTQVCRGVVRFWSWATRVSSREKRRRLVAASRQSLVPRRDSSEWLRARKSAVAWSDSGRGPLVCLLVKSAGDWLLHLASRLCPDVIHLNGYAHASLPWRGPILVVGHSCVFSWWQAVHGNEPDAAWHRYQRE